MVLPTLMTVWIFLEQMYLKIDGGAADLINVLYLRFGSAELHSKRPLVTVVTVCDRIERFALKCAVPCCRLTERAS